jgi:hypothetical protein
MTDFLGNSVGRLNYGYVEYPTNLAELRSSYGEHFNFDDIEYKTTCFMLNRTSGARLDSDGLYCPFALNVIGPDDTSRNDGDVYNRFYEVSLDVKVDHEQIRNTQLDDGKFWMDKAGTVKSISSAIEPDNYRSLIYNGSTEVAEIPEQMRKSVKTLVQNKCKLDDDYFNMVLA